MISIRMRTVCSDPEYQPRNIQSLIGDVLQVTSSKNIQSFVYSQNTLLQKNLMFYNSHGTTLVVSSYTQASKCTIFNTVLKRQELAFVVLAIKVYSQLCQYP